MSATCGEFLKQKTEANAGIIIRRSPIDPGPRYQLKSLSKFPFSFKRLRHLAAGVDTGWIPKPRSGTTASAARPAPRHGVIESDLTPPRQDAATVCKPVLLRPTRDAEVRQRHAHDSAKCAMPSSLNLRRIVPLPSPATLNLTIRYAARSGRGQGVYWTGRGGAGAQFAQGPV